MHVAGPNLTTHELNEISCRTLVMVGDDDEVALEHALAFYRSLPKGKLAVIPGTSHGLLIEKSVLCEFVILDFLRHEMVHSIASIRRNND
jgi:pimeloyl-ACP methyl ester carboxylesterase